MFIHKSTKVDNSCRSRVSLQFFPTQFGANQFSPYTMGGLSTGEKQFIEGGIAQDIRTDGRQRRDFCPISVETGVIPHANGSTRVKLGATDVIASVKAELGRPSSLHPDKGKVAIFVDYLVGEVFPDSEYEEVIAV